MSLELITAIGRWLLPVLAGLILVSCGGVLIRGNRKTGTIGYVVNAANGDSMALRQFETSIGRSKLCDIVATRAHCSKIGRASCRERV